MATKDISKEISSSNDREKWSDTEDDPLPQSTAMLLSTDKKFLEQRIDELTKFKRYQDLVHNNRDNLTEPEGQLVSQSDLLEAKCLEFAKNYAIESTQLSHLIHRSTGENNRDPFTEEVLSLLTDNSIISEDITKVKDELDKAKQTLIGKTQELELLAKKKRQLWDEIKKSEDQYATDEKDSMEIKQLVQKGKEQIKREKRKLELISALGTRMIFASGVDWIESEELMDMLSIFGEDMPENID